MLSCKDASRLVSDSLDRQLSWRQRLSLRIHLLMCGVCARFRRQVLFLNQAAKQYISESRVGTGDAAVEARIADTRLAEDVRERIKQALRSPGP
jgi:hypothetical protein